MVQWGPGPDALFLLNLIKVHDIKPNYQAIAASMGEAFTHRALSHRMDALRAAAEKYENTMALQASAAATSIQASVKSPAKENKRGSTAAAPNTRSKTATTTKISASKDKGPKNSPLKATAKAGVKKRSAPAAKGKASTKAEAKGKQVEEAMKGDDEEFTDATISDMEAEMQADEEDYDQAKMECV